MSANFNPQPVLLEGRHVRLEPMERSHLAALVTAASDPAIFQFFLTPPLGAGDEMAKWMDAILQRQAEGTDVGWVAVRQSDRVVVGATTYLEIRRAHRGLEIGNTWLSRHAQRTAINTEAKYLLLRHAFESLGAVRVQLKTDERNERSRAAILRIGAKYEGILRRYQARFDGYVRNTAMFALIAEDWPEAKVRLESMLARA